LRELTRPLLDDGAADLRLERQCLAERDHGRFVPLTEPFERARDADAAGIRAEDAGPDLRLRALVDVEHAVFLRPADPLVRAPAVEVRLHVAQIDVHQAERLSAVNEAQDAALSREPANLLRRKEVADRARLVRDRNRLRARCDRPSERVDVVRHPWMWIG